MVLEAHHLADALGLGEHVADAALGAGRGRDGGDVEQPRARQLLAARGAVARPEQLEAAADREERGAPGLPLPQPPGVALQVGRDAPLLAILSPADQHEVGFVRQRAAELDALDLAAEAVRLAAGAQRDHVAAVGVDVHQLGVEPDGADRILAAAHAGDSAPRGSAARSAAQYGAAPASAAAASRSAIIAV